MPTALVTPPVCPSGSPIEVVDFPDAESICFAGRDVEIKGWLDGPPALGFEPPDVEPGWMYYPVESGLTLWEAPPTGPDQTCQIDGRSCARFFPHLNPASGLTLDGPPRWVILTGHTWDPAAETCRMGIPDPTPEDTRIAIARCRAGFVVTAIRDAP